ncbi:MAG: hypothetical protein IJB31_07600 [Akkermansia sp.]|nr:hypothetical protein [Akkermansia sp.]
MKKTIAIIAAVCVTTIGFCMGTSTAAEVIDTKSFDAHGMRCISCKGTGFSNGGTGPFNCLACKGTGRCGSY